MKLSRFCTLELVTEKGRKPFSWDARTSCYVYNRQPIEERTVPKLYYNKLLTLLIKKVRPRMEPLAAWVK